MNSFDSYSESILRHDNVDRALEAYLEFLEKDQISGAKVIHKKAAIRRIAATVLYAFLVFLTVSFFVFFHEFHFFYCISGITALTVAWGYIIGTFFTTEKALRPIIQANPNTDIERILANEAAGFRKMNVVWEICGSIIAITLVLAAAAYWSPHMIFQKNSSGYSLRNYTLSLHPTPEVEIPDQWKGEPVTEIRGCTFYGMNSLKRVRLPSGITEIQTKTFENCRNLESIEIPEGTTAIGRRAFCDCRNLSSVTVPSTMETIGSSAFRRCYKLAEIILPYGCDVSSDAFKESGTKIYYSDGVTVTGAENTEEPADYKEYEAQTETEGTKSDSEIIYVRDEESNEKVVKILKPDWCYEYDDLVDNIWLNGRDGWMTVRYSSDYKEYALEFLNSDREYLLNDPELLDMEKVSEIYKSQVGDMEVYWFESRYRYKSGDEDYWIHYYATILHEDGYVEIEDYRIGDEGSIELTPDDFLKDVSHVSFVE